MAQDTAPDQCRVEVTARGRCFAAFIGAAHTPGAAGRRWIIFSARDFVMSFGPMGREAILA